MTDQPFRKSRYGEKLKDPRWQKVRLEVFNRDNFTCQWCGETTKTLNVHHLFYERGKEPWEYPLWAFLTVCEPCHGNEFEYRPGFEADLLLRLKQGAASCWDVTVLDYALSKAQQSEFSLSEIINALTFLANDAAGLRRYVELHRASLAEHLENEKRAKEFAERDSGEGEDG
jgi:hypothetical protein